MERLETNNLAVVNKLGEKTYSIVKGQSYCTLILSSTNKTIDFKIKKKFSPNCYEGIFTLDDFVKMNRLFYVFETLEEIQSLITDRLMDGSVDIEEEEEKLNLILNLNLEIKKQKVILAIPKNPEMNVNSILDDMSIAIHELEEKVKKLELTISQIETSPTSFMESSTIVKNAEVDLVKSWIANTDVFDVTFSLLYKGSIHGDKASDFHSKCDNQGPTISFIETSIGRRFGGYTALSWDGTTSYKAGDPSAFVFSMGHKMKFGLKNTSGNVIYCNPAYNVTFGQGHDFHIHDNYGNAGSYSNFPHSYNGQNLTNKPNTYLSGTYHFFVKEIEVYSVKMMEKKKV